MGMQVQQINISIEELLKVLEPFFRGPGKALYLSLQEFFKNNYQEQIKVPFEFEIDKKEEVDALAEIAAMAQPLGPNDLARNFNHYTQRTISDESTA